MSIEDRMDAKIPRHGFLSGRSPFLEVRFIVHSEGETLENNWVWLGRSFPLEW